MPRKATGTVAQRNGRWFARTTVEKDGKKTRPWIPLSAKTEEQARAQLAVLIEKDHAHPAAPQTFRSYSERWVESRRASGVAMTDSEASLLKLHVHPFKGSSGRERAFGERPLSVEDCTPRAIRELLEAVRAKGKSNQTITHVRGTLSRIFDQAWRDEIIPSNPVLKVKAPTSKNEVKRPREILTDEEIAQYLACAECDPELQIMSLVARCEGGMRTVDVNTWRWSMLDLATFASCYVPRTKSGIPQKLEIPEVLRGRLRDRWLACGSPMDGPIFPVRRGPRKGEEKKRRGVSYAKALRRDLKKAGLTRHGIFFDTPVSRKVDFHSFRRAFGTRAAEELPERHAMKLGGWESAQAFARYVMSSERMRTIPASVLPRNVSSLSSARAENKERDTRLELATLSLGKHCPGEIAWLFRSEVSSAAE